MVTKDKKFVDQALLYGPFKVTQYDLYRAYHGFSFVTGANSIKSSQQFATIMNDYFMNLHKYNPAIKSKVLKIRMSRGIGYTGVKLNEEWLEELKQLIPSETIPTPEKYLRIPTIKENQEKWEVKARIINGRVLDVSVPAKLWHKNNWKNSIFECYEFEDEYGKGIVYREKKSNDSL